ncbi:hypothetical protein F5B17DRAFT_436143 [Nemania serpens]|nr:hypothetical protein F5B17DRAFT_436143 [Nemania serpens]
MPDASLDLMADSGPGTILHARTNVQNGVCGQNFSRGDTLKRHIKRHTEGPQYPCPHCDGHQGPNAFYRRDHLRQHMRHVHRDHESPRGVEPQNQVPAPAAEPQSPEHQLPQSLEFQLHQFLCPVLGCTRYHEPGYFRQLDLNEHLMFFHGVPHDAVAMYAEQ